MEISTSSWMMIFFILALIISIWKIYAFLPNKQLVDDDRTKEQSDVLYTIMLDIIILKEGDLDEKELFEAMKNHASFDKDSFWRFNLNRLNLLLSNYYLKNPNVKNIKDIYEQSQDI
ncbi:hypothetical protein GJV85_10300 [Sulfurimonas aquatica]|uniref:Uncharacterized protein n=1 Tax=Sulfurimonas aquatica TaxID=2672570 RepID=A0A975B1P2_9BACT|nr:hypothetical protein [Sulfurimonas aquatica]QSZ42483.1 hypothetical protein GJV85_10300 [Sulfurimonas aquatica]